MDAYRLEDQFLNIQQGLRQARYICEVLNEYGLPRDCESKQRYDDFAALLESVINRAIKEADAYGVEVYG